MNGRYFLEVSEGEHRIPVGHSDGYATYEEAATEAKNKVDDALPDNRVRIMLSVAHAYLGGDGEPYITATGG